MGAGRYAFLKMEGESLKKVIKFHSVDKVKEFVNIANCAGEVLLSSEGITVNGKSIMSIFSLNLNNKLLLDVNSEEDISEFIYELKPYVVS